MIRRIALYFLLTFFVGISFVQLFRLAKHVDELLEER